ncbi:hypothetical protein PanWU01x14_192550, partial [Parasponia andersonii]
MPLRKRVSRQELRIDILLLQQEIPDPLADLYKALWEILGLRAERNPKVHQ